MAIHNGLHVGSAAHPVLAAVDARLAQSGMLAPSGPGALDLRLGVMYPCPGGFSVSGTSSTSPWQYSVPAAAFVTSKGTLDGGRVNANDAPYLASTIAPPASNSRYDVIYVMQQDADATVNADGTTAAVIAVVNGAAAASPTIPSIPVGAYQLAHALVPSGAAAGTADAAVTITQDFLWTTTRGAAIPVRSQAERDALTLVDGLSVWRLDLHTIEVYSTGTGWDDLATQTRAGQIYDGTYGWIPRVISGSTVLTLAAAAWGTMATASLPFGRTIAGAEKYSYFLVNGDGGAQTTLAITGHANQGTGNQTALTIYYTGSSAGAARVDWAAIYRA